MINLTKNKAVFASVAKQSTNQCLRHPKSRLLWSLEILDRHRPVSHRRDDFGFSLLEIMIAVAILAASAVTLLSAQGGAFLSSQRAERLTQATMLAREKMVEIEMEFQKDLSKNKFPEENVEKEGEFEEPFNDFRWSYTVKKIELPPPPSSGEENALIASKINQIIEQVAKNARQIQLTILWGDPEVPVEEQPKMTVTTHWVKMK